MSVIRHIYSTHLLEDKLSWKTPFDGRRLLMEATFGERQSLMKDKLLRRANIDGRRLLIEDDL